MTHNTTTHVHDPDPPRGRKYPVWTLEEIEKLERLKAEGRTYKEIGAALNREPANVKQRWRWLNITDEERASRAERNARARQDKGGAVNPFIVRRRSLPLLTVMPDEVFTDRHHRINAPRTLTAIFCGDPAPGWSALDRKRQEMRA